MSEGDTGGIQRTAFASVRHLLSRNSGLSTSRHNSDGYISDYDDEDETPAAEARKSAYDLLKAKGDNERVRSFRFLVGGMLLMTAVVTGVAFYFLGAQEHNNFETAYYQFARTLADAAINQQQGLRDSMDSLGTAITSYAQTNNKTWPFVVIPQFEAFAKGYFDHSHGEYVGINNIVYHKDRDAFINWTTAHYQDWIAESHMIKYGNTDRLDTDPSKYNNFLAGKIDGQFVPDIDREYYSVRTSESPPMRAYGPLFNLNIGSLGTVELMVQGLVKLKYETLVTSIQPYSALPAEDHKYFHQNLDYDGRVIEVDEVVDHPHSFMYHPIYERVHDYDSRIVAQVNAAVAWDASMRHLLPETVHGIHCVIRNNCDQVFTYEVNGPNAMFLGREDVHNPKYDDMMVQVELDMHTHPDFATTPHHCQYTVYIYPTDTFRNDYTTHLPLFFTLVVASSFSFVALVFFLYDFRVQRRNEQLADNAAKSNKLVASLFPEQIKDKLLEQQKDSNRKMEFLTASQKEHHDASPLAMNYPQTTIMFADLAGFTSWSSTRTPEEVFELLEAIYSAFDGLARSRKVFKVETIGDCYVAATGLPQPQSDHALRMCQFAYRCLQTMDTVVQELSTALGNDTAALKLRVGLHSGRVTGGVLRGDKSRFQLFGDTMNTASRMESNGVPGKIHVSKSTADEVKKRGKGKWLTARPDKIVAKGKGEMETFFLNVPATLALSSRSSTLTISSTNEDTCHSNHDESLFDYSEHPDHSHRLEDTSSNIHHDNPFVGRRTRSLDDGSSKSNNITALPTLMEPLHDDEQLEDALEPRSLPKKAPDAPSQPLQPPESTPKNAPITLPLTKEDLLYFT